MSTVEKSEKQEDSDTFLEEKIKQQRKCDIGVLLKYLKVKKKKRNPAWDTVEKHRSKQFVEFHCGALQKIIFLVTSQANIEKCTKNRKN